jgi:hypothetical protein
VELEIRAEGFNGIAVHRLRKLDKLDNTGNDDTSVGRFIGKLIIKDVLSPYEVIYEVSV